MYPLLRGDPHGIMRKLGLRSQAGLGSHHGSFLTGYIASPEPSVDKDLSAVSGIKRKKCPD